MFGAFKRLFSKPAEPEQSAAPLAQPTPAQTPAPAATPAKPPSAATATPAATAHSDAPGPEGKISLALPPILAALPPNLAVLAGSVREGTFSLPIKTALAQLSSGAVRVSFGELRQGSPPGAFQDNATQDRSVVTLPLAQVLAAMDPALLTRRTGQKVVAVPESVTSIFGKHQSFNAQAAVNPVGSAPEVPEAAAATAAPAPEPVPLPKPAAPEPGASHFTIRPAAPVLPTMPAAAKPSVTPPPTPSFAKPPGAPAFTKPPGSSPLPSAFAKPPGSSPLPSAFAKPPGSAPLPSMAPKSPASAPLPFAAPKPAATPAPAATETEFVVVALGLLKSSWPAPVQTEIDRLELAEASVSLPLQRLDAGMKTGRVTFTWKELSQWLEPAPVDVSAETGGTSLELPLSVIAPLFLARRRPGGPQKKVVVGANIPDLFAGAGQAPAAEAPGIAAAAAQPSAAPVAAAPPATDALGEIFGHPDKSEWTPAEIIQRICALKGVAGGALTMSDGLPVAGQIPAPLQAETVAAFVPQIFGRVSQSAGEMQLGGLTSMVLTAGSAQCAIYKTGKLYLAVLGRPGEPLPEAVLERIAAELAKRNP